MTFDNIDKTLLKRFKEFHVANPHVYHKFRELAHAMRNTGRTKYSAKALIEKIRWDHDISTTGDVFTINNDFAAIYARLLIYHDPSYTEFFEMRRMKPNRRQISIEQMERELDIA